MPVSPGRWLSNSVNASSPPAEAPTPTIMRSELPLSHSSAAGRAIIASDAGFTAAVELFPGERVRRFFGLGESGTRGERAIPPGQLLPVFFAKLYHCLSRRDEQASLLEWKCDDMRSEEHTSELQSL